MKLFIFGSTGDLFKRKVITALREIKDIEIVALGRNKLSDEQYFEKVCPTCDDKIRKRTKYLPITFSDKIQCLGCDDYFSKKKTNYFYIALPPEKIIETLTYICSVKKFGYKIKVLIEKPFGSSKEEASGIKNFIETEKLEEDVFLADHYLFKKNIMDIKLTDFKKIKITSLEKLGIEKRIFYDSVGAINDMVQSHLLNVLIRIIGIESLSFFEIEKVEVGQYKKYAEEIGKKSETETYTRIKLKKNEKGIIIETGKKFSKKESYIEIDGERIEMDGGKDAYFQMLEDFLYNKKEKFPTIEQSIRCWKLVNEIKKNKHELFYY